MFRVNSGFVCADRYVVLGAQRDAFSHGFAKSTVGTALLVELATAVRDMMKGEETRDMLKAVLYLFILFIYKTLI